MTDEQPRSSFDGLSTTGVSGAALDARLLTRVGRQARLELVFERREGRTALAHAYAEPPFRIAPCFAIGDAAYYIVTCAAPGVFGGDSLHVEVRVGRGARVVLTSQAALQVHPAAALKRPPAAPADSLHRG